jgi:phosphopantothenoylcysteine decarboxylase/phosphopantothenate--cysteine ligase
MLAGRNITLGVTGGIAVYKAAQLASNLRADGAEVHVIMTRSAREFVSPLTFQVLTNNRVYGDLFEPVAEWKVQHIELAALSELLVVVPATANILGKVAGGIADDLLSTVIMATTYPVLFCPAMNMNMYQNPVTQRNLVVLRDLGYHFAGPGKGRLACGVEGVGRLADLAEIMAKIHTLLPLKGDLRGLKIMVTAGPTLEPIDPVRYLTNRSSGKMGYALANAAARRGASVTLISGPTSLQAPNGVELTRVETASEMFQAVMEHFPRVDIVIKAAAVADYRPREVCGQKIKKTGATLVIECDKNPDILAELGRRKTHQTLVGFAAETSDLEGNAIQKVKRKNLDLLVANDITLPGAGFDADTNIVKLVYPGEFVLPLPIMDKLALAHRILDEVLNLRRNGQ